jgi:hypothetical protein
VVEVAGTVVVVVGAAGADAVVADTPAVDGIVCDADGGPADDGSRDVGGAVVGGMVVTVGRGLVVVGRQTGVDCSVGWPGSVRVGESLRAA